MQVEQESQVHIKHTNIFHSIVIHNSELKFS